MREVEKSPDIPDSVSVLYGKFLLGGPASRLVSRDRVWFQRGRRRATNGFELLSRVHERLTQVIQGVRACTLDDLNSRVYA